MAISRQLKWQRKQILKRRCTICGKAAPKGSRCNSCGVKVKRYHRKKYGWKAYKKAGKGRVPKYS